MTEQVIVEVRNATHTYSPSSRRGTPVQALRDVSFTVGKGEVFGLLGPNGGGKTTLFKILSTLMKPTSGTILIHGRDIVLEPAEARKRIGVAFQFPSLDKKLTARENLWHHGHLYSMRGRALNVRIDEMLARLGLQDRGGDIVETLSGGMARRVELAKTLLHGPEVLLLDEPSTGLDPGARRDLWEHLQMLRKRDGVTVLMTTHLMEEAAGCDRLALLHKGQIVALGSPARLTSEIGGDVITVHTAEPESLLSEVRGQFGIDATVLDGAVRIERSEGHQFIPQLVEAFPGRIEAVSLGKPTLEDVFIHRTGHRLWESNEQPVR
jgi:ABC-2 type transport system ATP-binding protein